MIVCLALALLAALATGNCPPQEDLAPHCTCMEAHAGGMLQCNDMFSPSELVAPVQACQGHQMFAIGIHDSSLLYIPHDLFVGTDFQKLRLFNTQLMSLSDQDVAFRGLENTLTELRATEAHYVAQWRLSQLRQLRKVDLIDINWIQLDALTEDLPPMPELTAIGISHASLSYIVDEAFSKCPKLKILDLSSNLISELKRSMFPSPANQLAILNLEDNEIERLPEGMFEAMPSLVDINLSKNSLTIIDEKVFSDVLGRLYSLLFAENPIRCDCRMSWMVGVKKPFTFKAECSSPASLVGWKVENVPRKQLWCLR